MVLTLDDIRHDGLPTTVSPCQTDGMGNMAGDTPPAKKLPSLGLWHKIRDSTGEPLSEIPLAV